MENESKQTIIEISPISKIKRILIFLGDFFFNFMLGFLLFGVAVTPLGKVMTDYETKSQIFANCEQEKIDILYENNLIFVEDETYKYDQHSYVYFTYDLWLSYFIIDGSEEFELGNPKFGQYEDNLVIKHYFEDIRNDLNAYYGFFRKYNDKYNYFIITETNEISLKEEYKEQLIDVFNPKSELSSVGGTLYQDIASYIFLALCGEVFNDISVNDLSSPNATRTYNENDVISTEIQKYHRTLLSVCSLISFFISTLFCYFLLPIILKSRRTVAMCAFKVNRINVGNLRLTNKLTTFIHFAYSIVFNLGYVMFLPISLVSFAYIFEFSMLASVSVVSMFFALISFIFLLFNKMSMTISDRLTNTVLITEDDLNEVYRAKGYLD